MDTVFFGLLTDMEAFTREALLALQLGFTGKFLIHPTQIEGTNKIFSPAPDEVDYARKVVEAFEEAQSRGLGAVSLGGKMIDIMSYRQAKDLVNFADIIAEKEARQKGAAAISLAEFFSTDQGRG